MCHFPSCFWPFTFPFVLHVSAIATGRAGLKNHVPTSLCPALRRGSRENDHWKRVTLSRPYAFRFSEEAYLHRVSLVMTASTEDDMPQRRGSRSCRRGFQRAKSNKWWRKRWKWWGRNEKPAVVGIYRQRAGDSNRSRLEKLGAKEQ